MIDYQSAIDGATACSSRGTDLPRSTATTLSAINLAKQHNLPREHTTSRSDTTYAKGHPPRNLVQCDTLFSDTHAILWIYSSYANGCAVWLYVGLDRQSVGTYTDALHQQRHGSNPLFRGTARGLEYRRNGYYRHKRHPVVGYRQYSDNNYWNLCFSSFDNDEQCFFADVEW